MKKSQTQSIIVKNETGWVQSGYIVKFPNGKMLIRIEGIPNVNFFSLPKNSKKKK